jgi:hypothetical protein
METDDLKGEGHSLEVGLIPKGYGQIDLYKGFGLFSRHDTMERCPGWSDARPVHAHGIERLDVHDVEATTSIH